MTRTKPCGLVSAFSLSGKRSLFPRDSAIMPSMTRRINEDIKEHRSPYTADIKRKLFHFVMIFAIFSPPVSLGDAFFIVINGPGED